MDARLEYPVGFWPVSSQEIKCCVDYYGSYDQMTDAARKHDVYFYVYDAGLPTEQTVRYQDVLLSNLPRVLTLDEAHPLSKSDHTAITRFIARRRAGVYSSSMFQAIDFLELKQNPVVLDSLFTLPALSVATLKNEESEFIPRNRRERRQDKCLDSKYKGKTEWWKNR